MIKIRSNAFFFLIFIIILLLVTTISYSVKQYYNKKHSIISGYNIKVIDGDIIKVNDITIRLYGIDAPERNQLCYNKTTNEPYKCGLIAKNKLRKLIQGKKIYCHKKNLDKYNRTIAICYVNGIDIAQQLIRKGLALAYRKFSDLYIEDELYAQQNNSYIWNNEFIPPWDYRYHLKKQLAEQKN
ncbi:MAG: thermonuclease family protein [Rickettsiales endosymbiont of Dermacentor nuttalli]